VRGIWVSGLVGVGPVSLAGFRQGVIDVWNVWCAHTKKDNDGRRKGKEGEVFFA